MDKGKAKPSASANVIPRGFILNVWNRIDGPHQTNLTFTSLETTQTLYKLLYKRSYLPYEVCIFALHCIALFEHIYIIRIHTHTVLTSIVSIMRGCV